MAWRCGERMGPVVRRSRETRSRSPSQWKVGMAGVGGKLEGTEAHGGLRRFLGEGTIEDEAGGIATCGLEAGQDGVFSGLVGGDEQDVGLLSGRAVGERSFVGTPVQVIEQMQ